MQVDRPLTSSNAAPTFVPGFSTQLPTARPPPPVSGPGHRRGHVSFDMSLHQNLTKLDIRGNKDASQWSQQTIGELRNIASQPFDSLQQQTVEPIINRTPDASRPPEQPAAGANSNGPTTPSQNKRRGWYNGPLPTSTPTGPLANPSPEDSSSSEGVATPSASAPEYHPAIVPSHGDIERHHSHIQTETPHNWQTCAPREPQSTDNNAYPVYPNPEPRHVFYSGSPNHPAGGMARLEALVAVATSEDKGTSKFI
ncbi:C2H2 transcription factor [Histoplasma capsulatum H143]|uniref:C2H2 transcription factor n=1 Tax=Ajellomyces capsulatus (strain H143) TaxID=544712 RepID=C6H798_AJECH|nr:C2H2 transcription factor [Histoplasma capsulatum H143]